MLGVGQIAIPQPASGRQSDVLVVNPYHQDQRRVGHDVRAQEFVSILAEPDHIDFPFQRVRVPFTDCEIDRGGGLAHLAAQCLSDELGSRRE
jgi:hypothetical protein